MLFNSPVFIFIFLPTVLLVYFALGRCSDNRLSKVWLVGASLFFYGYWNAVYIFLLIGSIGVNFFIGIQLQRSYGNKSIYRLTSRKSLAVIGVVFNIALLGYFKYADFFVQNTFQLLDKQGPSLDIILPLAISFFTFQQIAFIIDRYKEPAESPDNLLDYSLFVCFFPQLIAGPIVHHKQMMPQFRLPNSISPNVTNLSIGIFIFTIGLFKKVVIADTFAIWANAGFDKDTALNFFEAWATSLSYTFQLYYDFSGYTDMALGAALMFNIRLPVNFNSPYKATSIQDFWRRWHITLSTWLRDYIYIPFGGNRFSRLITYRNLLLTFLIGGIWHGAAWTFVVWGALHGFALAINRAWSALGIRLPVFLGWATTFLFVNAAWVMFRADSIAQAFSIWTSMMDVGSIEFSRDFIQVINYLNGQKLPLVGIDSDTFMSIRTGLAILCFGAIAFCSKNSVQLSGYLHASQNKHRTPNYSAGIVAALLFFTCMLTILGTSRPAEFLYFNF